MPLRLKESQSARRSQYRGLRAAVRSLGLSTRGILNPDHLHFAPRFFCFCLLPLAGSKTIPCAQADRVFPPEAGNEAIFADVRSLVTSVLDGYNVCVFAYGQARPQRDRHHLCARVSERDEAASDAVPVLCRCGRCRVNAVSDAVSDALDALMRCGKNKGARTMRMEGRSGCAGRRTARFPARCAAQCAVRCRTAHGAR